MKKFLFLAVAVAMITGCGKDVTIEEAGAKKVSFDVQGNWNSPVFTRGSLSADGKEMTDLWLFDYVDGTLVQTVHQVSTDADFGTPAPTLSYGEHRIYFVVSRGANPVINGTVISWGSIRDTFWKAMSVTVGGASASAYSVALDRVVTKLKLTVTDEVKAECAEVAVEPVAWYYGWDYVNGAPVAQQQTERVVAVPANLVGTSGQLAVTIFGLSGSTEWTTDVTVSARTAEHAVIGTATMTDVPFKANRATEYSGPLFGTAGSMTLTLCAEWDTSATGTW